MLELKIPGIVTTYITGTWTTLISGVVSLMGGGQGVQVRERIRFEERLWMQGGILAVYFLSAVFTGFLFRRHTAQVGVLPTASIFTAAFCGLVRGGMQEG